MTTRAIAKTVIPRRMFLTDNKGSRVPPTEVEKVLPYVDIHTGTKNRLVDRDPISGLGDLPKEHDPLNNNNNRSRIPRPITRASPDDFRDPILGKGDLGAEFSCMYDTKEVKVKEKIERDPISLRGDLGIERDIFHTENNKPRRVKDVKDGRRNPISGTGDHGREWDVIYGYSGRPRRSKSAGPADHEATNRRGGVRSRDPITQAGIDPVRNNLHSPRETRGRLDGFRYSYKYLDDYIESKARGNPITGEKVSSYDIMSEDTDRRMGRRSRRDMFDKRNPVTGENCKEDLYSREMTHRRKRERSLHNPLTGHDCDSYTVHVELERRRQSPTTTNRRANPLTGQNCSSYTYLQESRDRQRGEFIYTNPLTGHNRDTYFIIDFENKINQRPFRGNANPLTGNGCTTYVVSNEERARQSREKDGINPVTGEGCSHYVLTTDERKVNGNKPASQNNPITGEKCDSYEINMDMRSSKKIFADGRKMPLSNGQSSPIDCNTPRKLTAGRPMSIALPAHRNGFHVIIDRPRRRSAYYSKYNPLTGEAY